MPNQTIGERAAALHSAAQQLEAMLDGQQPPEPESAGEGVVERFQKMAAGISAGEQVAVLPENPEHVREVLDRYLNRRTQLQPHQVAIALKLLSQQVQELALLVGELAKR